MSCVLFDIPKLLSLELSYKWRLFECFQYQGISMLHCFTLLVFPNGPQSPQSIKNMIKLILNLIDFTFSVICLSETWWDDSGAIEKSLFERPNHMSKDEARSDSKGGGVSIYIHKLLGFIVKPNLSINNNDLKSLTVEILSDKKESL